MKAVMASPYPRHLCLLHNEQPSSGDRAFINELVQGLQDRDLQTWCALVDPSQEAAPSWRWPPPSGSRPGR